MNQASSGGGVKVVKFWICFSIESLFQGLSTLLQMSEFHIFKWMSSIPLCVYHMYVYICMCVYMYVTYALSIFIHYGHLVWFHILATQLSHFWLFIWRIWKSFQKITSLLEETRKGTYNFLNDKKWFTFNLHVHMLSHSVVSNS